MAKRGMAFLVAVALSLSVLTIAPPAKAAVKTKPALAVKKKTLYYNKKGKQTYTLKVKKNKVKKISKTTWKTSKKSVVSISKKKKTSVKLTAKKKGTATVTATIRYVPKGMWMVRTLKLKCKITSKKASVKKPKKTPKPTQTPLLQTVSKVELDEGELFFNDTENGKNTETLTATAFDKKGVELKEAAFTWKSDDEKVAQVSAKGVVTAKKEGTANIRASVGTVESEPCVVTVDTTAPSIEGAVITDYKTITVYFDEKVEGTPEVSVTSDDGEETVEMEPELAGNGKSLVLTSDHALSAGKYELQVDGLTDHVKNELQSNKVIVVKKASAAKEFICRTDEVPQGQSKVTVYYAVLDQYGEEMTGSSITGLKASAMTESGMPLDASLDQQKKCVVISGAVSMLAEGKKILITLSSTSPKLNAELETVLVDGSDAGRAAKIGRVAVSSAKMKMEGSEESPEFTLTKTAADNEFVLKAELLDKFGLQAEKAGVVYVIDSDSDVVEFADSEGSNSKTTNIADSDTEVRVKALKGGTASITAYLVSDDSQRMDIQVTIHPTALTGITVENLPEEGCFNNRPSEAKITLDPVGTGITAKDLQWSADTDSKKRIKTGINNEKQVKFIDNEDGSISVQITAENDGLSDPITFTVYYEDDKSGRVESDPVLYQSSPLPVVDSIQIDPFVKAVPEGSEGTTTYRLLNRYGENITEIAETALSSVRAEAESGSSSQVDNIKVEKGVLSVRGKSEGTGEATIKLIYNNSIVQSVKVKVASKAYIEELVLGEPQFANKTYEGLIKKDGNAVYIPLSAKDQYGNKYKITTSEIENWLNKAIIDGNSKIDLVHCKGDGKEVEYSAASGTDEVTAIQVKWRDGGLTDPGDIRELMIQVKSTITNHACESKEVRIAVKPERQINELRFEKESVTVLEGCQVENKIHVVDQYKEPILIGGNETIKLSYRDKDGGTVSLDNSISLSPDSVGEWISSAVIRDSGTYTVTAYVDNGTGLTSATKQASYTQVVGEASQMIDRIEIDDMVTIDANPVKQYNLSEIDYIKLTDIPDSPIAMTFDYHAFDAKSNEIVLQKNSFAKGEMVWSIKSAEGVDAKIGDDDKITAYMEQGKKKGQIVVQLEYVPTGKIIERTISVSSEEPVAKDGTYKIVEAEIGSVNDDTPGIKDKTVSITEPTEYHIWAKDQYGDWIEVEKIYTAISTNKKVATAEINSDPARVTVTPVGFIGSQPKTAEIKVHVTQNEIITFKTEVSPMVEAFETKEITEEVFSDKKESFKNTFYNKDPASWNDDDIERDGYFTIPFAQDSPCSDKSIKSVALKTETLKKDNIQISVGMNHFISMPDYIQTNEGLKISYVFVALHDTDPEGEMHFTVTFEDGMRADAVLKIAGLEDDLICNSITAEKGPSAPVDVRVDGSADKITGAELIMKPDSQTLWNHMILLKFSAGNTVFDDTTCYFTKKVVNGKVSYGFTSADGAQGELGYYPHQYVNGAEENEVVTEYTVATADRHGVVKLILTKKDEVTSVSN